MNCSSCGKKPGINTVSFKKLLCAQTLLLVWVERVLQRCADYLVDGIPILSRRC